MFAKEPMVQTIKKFTAPSVGVIILLAIVDILDNGMFTTGFIGMLVLILGALLIPTILKLIKEKN